MHSYHDASLRTLMIAGTMLSALAPALAAEVTPARLANP